MPDDHIALLKSAFDQYVSLLFHESAEPLDPSGHYLAYEFDFLCNRKWHMLGEMMVACDLRELTNLVNRWKSLLHRWHAWNRVAASYDEDQAWELHHEFLEALAHDCLTRPSSMRDAITAVATNSLHQVRCALGNGYADRLDGDPSTPDSPHQHLSRAKKEKRLANIASIWSESKSFLAVLRSLDDASYRQQTSDYRNLTNHAIGPRLGVGITRTVTRVVIQATRMQEDADGSCREVEIPGQMAVCYGFGGTEPLDYEGARLANLEQFLRARDCYVKFMELLQSAVNSIPSVDGG